MQTTPGAVRSVMSPGGERLDFMRKSYNHPVSTDYQCQICNTRFADVDAFDAHQNDDDPPQCFNPQDIGLVSFTIWGFKRPQSNPRPKLAVVTQLPTKPTVKKSSSTSDRQCRDCGNLFQIPKQRGRPAVRCESCRGV